MCGTCQRALEPRIGRTGRGVRDLQIVGDRSSSGTTSQISSFFRPLNTKAPLASIFLFAAHCKCGALASLLHFWWRWSGSIGIGMMFDFWGLRDPRQGQSAPRSCWQLRRPWDYICPFHFPSLLLKPSHSSLSSHSVLTRLLIATRHTAL